MVDSCKQCMRYLNCDEKQQKEYEKLKKIIENIEKPSQNFEFVVKCKYEKHSDDLVGI